MKKFTVSFILICILCMALPTSGQAQEGFSLVNGICTGGDMDDAVSEEWHYLWKAMRIDFTQTDEFTYSGYGEASATDRMNEDTQRLIEGNIQVEYNAQTGFMKGTFEIVHTDSTTLKNGTGYDVIQTFSGDVEAEVNPTASQVTLILRGPLEQDFVSRGYQPQVPVSTGVQIENYLMTVAFDVQGSLPSWSCSPMVLGIEGLQPGDTIAPSATYYNADGKQTDVLNESWTINDQKTDALIWDGSETTIILKWTCPDNKEYSTTFVIPAYAGLALPTETPEPTPTATALPQPTQEEAAEIPVITDEGQNALGGLSSLGIAGIAIGATALVGMAAAFASGAVKTSAIMQAAPKELVPSPTASEAAPSSVTQPESYEEPQNIEDERREWPTSKAKLSPEERAKLISLRNEMATEMERIKNDWRESREAMQKLTMLKKKDMLKFMMRQGYEVQDWVTKSSTKAIAKLTLDPLVKEMVGAPDFSKDPNIIIAINNRIEALKAEMKQMVNEVYYLNREIAKIDRKLSK